MIKSQIFALMSLLVGLLITLYFIVVSKYRIISTFQIANKVVNLNTKITEVERIISAAEASIQRASNVDVVNNMPNKYLMPKRNETANGRILVTFYREQQIGAAMSMFSLQKWATTIGASVVEPFVENSTFTLPSITSEQQLTHHLRFRDYFNVNIWNNMCIERNVTPLVPWDDFVNQVPKKFIFVMILKRLYKEERPIFIDDEILQQAVCNDAFVSFMKNYEFYINHLLKTRLVRRVCLSFYKTIMDIDNFTNVIYGDFGSSDTMVWFYQWKGFVKTNRVRVLQEYFYRSPEILGMLHTSKKIADDSKNYIRNVLRSEPGKYVAISIRTTLRAKHTPTINHTSFFYNCIDKLEQVINFLNGTGHVLFMSMDLGRFGDVAASSYMSQELINYVKERIFQVVYNNSLTMDQWEQSFIQATNGITDNGYIAAMQRTILVNSKCLVMFGGASNFQRNLLLSYKESRNNSCLYEVCYEP